MVPDGIGSSPVGAAMLIINSVYVEGKCKMPDNKCAYCTPDNEGYMNYLPTPRSCKTLTLQGGAGYREWYIDGGTMNTVYGLLTIHLDINFCPMCGRKLREEPYIIK